MDIADIARFKAAISAPLDASDSDEEYITRSSNRGSKLKRGASEVGCTVLNAPKRLSELRIININGKDRAVITKKTILFEEDFQPRQDDDDSDVPTDDDPEILEDVDVAGILAPVSDPAQLPNHPGVSRTYKSQILKQLASESLDMIVESKHRATQISNLLGAFLGDDPRILNVRAINLPTYDTEQEERCRKQDIEKHDRKLAKKDGTDNVLDDRSTLNPAEETVQAKVEPLEVSASAPEAEATEIEAEAEAETETTKDLLGITSQITAEEPASGRRLRVQTQAEVEPFFAPPDIHTDRNFGVSSEAAERARQMLQVAHQRMDEFVRCLTEIRMGLTKADRRRQQVLNWCREMNNEDHVEAEIGPDLHHTWVSNRNISNNDTEMSATESRHDRSD